MRIGLGTLQDEFALSGEFQAFRGWAEALAAAGLEARLFSPRGERLRGHPYLRVPAGEFVLRKVFEQWSFLDRCELLAGEVDALHLFLPSPYFLWIGDRIKRRTGRPVLVTCLGEDPDLTHRQWLALCRRAPRFHAVRYAARLLSPASRFLCDRYIAGSDHVAGQLRRAGCPQAKLAVACPRLPAEPAPDERSLRLARELAERPTFLYVGHFLPNKGVDVLLTAFAGLAAPEAALLLVWSGLGDLAAVRRQLRALALTERVRIVEHPVHRSTVFVPARALVLPFTSSFGQVSPPVVLLEALRAGVPLLVSRSPSLDGLGPDGEALWRAAPGDWRGLRALMELVLREPERTERMRRAQRRLYGRLAAAPDLKELYG
ncbi:MAG: glycosyltransferase [Elusimicrobia bacterium]|nr:glycosyltransferase [Elusimicrobiota bacterium]